MTKIKGVARVPRYRSRRTKRLLREFVSELVWTVHDPTNNVPNLVSRVADLCHAMYLGARADLAEDLQERAQQLRKSGERDDLVAAAELEDVAAEILELIDPCI